MLNDAFRHWRGALRFSPGKTAARVHLAIVVLNRSSFYIINLTIETRRKGSRDAYKQKRQRVIDIQVTRRLTAADARQASPFQPNRHLNFRLSNTNINRGSFYRDARNGIRTIRYDTLIPRYRSSACVHLSTRGLSLGPETQPSRK